MPKEPTEATATAVLQKRLYFGVGKKFLGWHIADEILQDDGSWKKDGEDDWRFWTVPDDEQSRRRWRPVHEHLKGLNRGLVSIGSTHVPCVTSDFDRHHASVDPEDHISRVLKGGQLLRETYPQLCWVAEVNPRNGSMKFFGFGHGPIPISRAEDCAIEIHDFLLRNCCGTVNEHGKQGIEVFPHNCVEVGLPMRAGKVTVVATGILPKCIRQRKGPDGYRENFETYSVLAFLRCLQERQSYHELTLLEELKKGCANLPFVPGTTAAVPRISEIEEVSAMITISTDAPLGPIVHKVKARPKSNVPKAKAEYGSEPNSYMRQLGAMLELCRRLKRVATVEEGLHFIRMNGLFSGDWSQNESRRKHRVAYLLMWISLTFDPSKCCGSTPRFGADLPINIGKYDNWARNFVGKVKGARRSVDEYGDVVERRSVSVDWQWVSVFLSVVEHCCVICPNEDGSLPQRWAEFIWRSLNQTGVISLQWDDRKWKVARDWLEKKGIIKIVDRNWQFRHGDGKAMKWAVSDDFHRFHVWWKSVNDSARNLAVQFADYLRSMLHFSLLKAYPHTSDSKAGFGRYQSPESASRGPP